MTVLKYFLRTLVALMPIACGIVMLGDSLYFKGYELEDSVTATEVTDGAKTGRAPDYLLRTKKTNVWVSRAAFEAVQPGDSVSMEFTPYSSELRKITVREPALSVDHASGQFRYTIVIAACFIVLGLLFPFAPLFGQKDEGGSTPKLLSAMFNIAFALVAIPSVVLLLRLFFEGRW